VKALATAGNVSSASFPGRRVRSGNKLDGNAAYNSFLLSPFLPLPVSCRKNVLSFPRASIGTQRYGH